MKHIVYVYVGLPDVYAKNFVDLYSNVSHIYVIKDRDFLLNSLINFILASWLWSSKSLPVYTTFYIYYSSCNHGMHFQIIPMTYIMSHIYYQGS